MILPDRPLVDRLCEKFPKAGKSAKSSGRAFDALNSTADRDLVKVWEEQEAAALLGRNVRPESMDIYDIKTQKGLSQLEYCAVIKVTNCVTGPSRDEMHLRLINDEMSDAGTKGGTTLLGQGLKIEDSQ